MKNKLRIIKTNHPYIFWIIMATIIMIIAVLGMTVFYSMFCNRFLSNNRLLENMILVLQGLSYVAGTLGALSIVVGVLQYSQSKSENNNIKLHNTHDLMDYYSKVIFPKIRFINDTFDLKYKNEIKEVGLRLDESPDTFGNELKHNVIYTAKTDIFRVDKITDNFNLIESWANYINEGYANSLINEYDIFLESHSNVIKLLKKYKPIMIRARMDYHSCLELLNRWSSY